MRTEIRAQKILMKNSIDIVVMRRVDRKRVAVAQPLKMDTHNTEHVIPEPTMSFKIDEAQMLMDELWGCGIRPSEGSGSAGSLRATEKHLKDMQRITMGLLKKDNVDV